MTDRRDFDDGAPGPDGLEAFFAAARGDAAQPDGALLSRIEADALAAECGFDTGLAVITAYFGNSDWTDTPHISKPSS